MEDFQVTFPLILHRTNRQSTKIMRACPYCPQAARLAHMLGIINDLIRAGMVKANEFPQLSQQYGAMPVPRTVINEDMERILDVAGDAQPEGNR